MEHCCSFTFPGHWSQQRTNPEMVCMYGCVSFPCAYSFHWRVGVVKFFLEGPIYPMCVLATNAVCKGFFLRSWNWSTIKPAKIVAVKWSRRTLHYHNEHIDHCLNSVLWHLSSADVSTLTSPHPHPSPLREQFKSDYEALQTRLHTLPDRVSHDVMVCSIAGLIPSVSYLRNWYWNETDNNASTEHEMGFKSLHWN